VPSATWSTSLSLAWLNRATKPDVLGFYTHCEVIEVLGYSEENRNSPVNVFSIVVLENRPSEAPQHPGFLNEKRIALRTLKGWTFGVCRYTTLLTQLAPTIECFCNTSEWSLGGKPLLLGDMSPVAPQFVPPDASEHIPLNQLLKNNFWNGSYILEFFDGTKRNLQSFFEHPPRLQELSEAVQKYLPLRLASLADRLGNIVIQLPVTVLMSEFHQVRDNEGFSVEAAWHPKATPRALRATCAMEFDGVFCGYGAAELQVAPTIVSSYDSSGSNRHLIWDQQNHLILAATGPLSYIREVSLSMVAVSNNPETRTFSVPKPNGSSESYKIYLHPAPHKSSVGEPDRHTHREWTRRRIYEEEVLRLTQERRFVQYQPQPGKQDECHRKALDDLRFLINKYGSGGAWIWDPYLNAEDILNTLFHCQHFNSDLRALTAGKEAPSAKSITHVTNSNSQSVANQHAVLDGAGNNYRGLCLEYRIKRGHAGWNFHDRFLIFPNVDGQALAWSLGTSVNNLGMAHHILQRVDNGRLIVDAFLDLWNRLDLPEHLVWKKP
jgi:hypothetical protein